MGICLFVRLFGFGFLCCTPFIRFAPTRSPSSILKSRGLPRRMTHTHPASAEAARNRGRLQDGGYRPGPRWRWRWRWSPWFHPFSRHSTMYVHPTAFSLPSFQVLHFSVNQAADRVHNQPAEQKRGHIQEPGVIRTGKEEGSTAGRGSREAWWLWSRLLFRAGGRGGILTLIALFYSPLIYFWFFFEK